MAGLLLAPAGAGRVLADELAGLADPTRPAQRTTTAFSAAPARSLVLQSILISPRRRIAMVNGQPFAVGDRLDDALVAEILPYAVVLKKGDQIIRMRLLPKVKSGPAENKP
jgi:MSHA biogenesis protein MshK